MEGMLKILMGGGLTALEIQTGGGLWTQKYILGGYFRFYWCFNCVNKLISFQKIALRFPVLLFFQTTELLPYLFQVSIHRLTFITFVCFCRSDVR